MQNLLSVIASMGDSNWLRRRHGLSGQQAAMVTGKNVPEDGPELKVKRMEQLRVFLEATKDLENQEIWFIPFKGPALSQKLYNDPLYRRYGDVDILVKSGDLTNVVEIFHRHGYQAVKDPFPTDLKKQQRVKKYWWQYPILHNQTQGLVEIHWRLMNALPVAQSVMNKLITQNHSQVRLWGRSFRQLNHELELIYLIIHGAKHAWYRLKWLLDIHHIAIHCPPDPHKFLQLAHTLNAHRMVCQVNQLMLDTFPNAKTLPAKNVPAKKITRYAKEMLLTKDPPTPSSKKPLPLKYRLRHKWYQLNLAPGLQYKLRFIKTSLMRWLFNQSR